MLELSKLARSFKMLVFLRQFVYPFVRVPLWKFSDIQCVCTLWFCFLPIFWGREFAYIHETSKINTAWLPHKWNKICSQWTMPGDRNSILCWHCVSFTFAWGYWLLFNNFAFYVQCLTVARVSQPSSKVATEIRISQQGPHSHYVLFR